MDVKKSNDEWRLVQDLRIINEAVVSFTCMLKTNRNSFLQVWLDTFTGWIEAFPCYSKQVKEVVKILIHEIIPRFELSQSLQSDNAPLLNLL